MPFVDLECCGRKQEEFIFPDEVDSRKTAGGLLRVSCEECGKQHEGKPVMAMSLGRLPAAYEGKTVRDIDKEYAHLEGVRHLERGTVEHKRHVEALREDGEQRAKEAGYRDRKHMRRTVRERKNINAAVAARGA